MVTMGGDFTYQDSIMWYTNLDKLIKYGNLKSAKDGLNIKLFYSTPDCYLKAVRDASPILPIKQDDFFPYASDPTAYWTGYFTSRPTTKYFERQGNDYLQMNKQLQVVADLQDHNSIVLDELRSALGVMQHHDAITGTEKQAVTHDYERILDQAIEDASIIAKQAFNKFLQGDALKQPIFEYTRCRLNESSCAASETSEQFVVTVYNPLGWMVKEPIRIPVLDGTYKVVAPNGEQIQSQLVEIPESVKSIPTRQSGATHELVFIAYLHPINVKSFFVQKINRAKRETRNHRVHNLRKNVRDTSDSDNDVFAGPIANDFGVSKGLETDVSKIGFSQFSENELRMLSDDTKVVEQYRDLYLDNGFIQIRINDDTGEITHVIQNNITTNFNLQFYYWTGFVGDNTNTSLRSSGAYIFRPTTTNPEPIQSRKEATIKGNVVQEFRTKSDKNTANSIRLYAGLPFIEHDFVIGPISIEDKKGKEYIVRYQTDVINNGVFYTDSNGRQVLKRKLNERPQYNLTLEEPVAGNYYPVTNEIYIENDNKRVAVLPDRSEGGTSLVEGTIELMLHRRLLHDDAFGVDEALNESANGKGLVMRGKHRILIEDTKNELDRKKNILQLHLQPIVYVSKAENIDLDYWLTLNNSKSALKQLPDGLHLLTLEPWIEGTILIRFENYLSNGILEVDLTDVLNDIRIKSVKETTLAANRFIGDHEPFRWNIKQEFSNSFNLNYYNYGPVTKASYVYIDNPDDGLLIKIKPKQIRTFIAEYEFVNP